MTKRLFLFAGYDAHGIVDASLVHYIREINKFGDVVFVMDSDARADELKKLGQYTIYAAATRHGEYDFGSYKRAYIWAKNNLDLSKYDIVYMVNDSVYGPLSDMHDVMRRMENEKWDAFGLVKNPHKTTPHIQSWFIGMRARVFLSAWFDEFIMSVKKLPDKGTITIMYEHGFTRRLNQNNVEWGALYSAPGRSIYNNIYKYFKLGMPFVKKNAFVRHNGAFGYRVWRVLNKCEPNVRNAIMDSANRAYGGQTISRNITSNPIRATIRGTQYMISKILNGGI